MRRLPSNGAALRLPSDRARLAPLMLATMASQALLVVLAPTIVAVGADLGASVAAVGQARSITAGIAIAASVAIASRIDSVAISRLLALGATLAIIGSATVAAAPTLTTFLLAHLLVGIALACLLSAGFAGVAAFARESESVGDRLGGSGSASSRTPMRPAVAPHLVHALGSVTTPMMEGRGAAGAGSRERVRDQARALRPAVHLG